MGKRFVNIQTNPSWISRLDVFFDDLTVEEQYNKTKKRNQRTLFTLSFLLYTS